MSDDQTPNNFDNDASMFRCVAMGTAAENKVIGSMMLKVMPHEKLSMADGEIADKTDTVEYSGQDESGNHQAGNSFIGQTINATWLPESNRHSAPDIRRNERISLWQFAGNDKYYWRDEGLDKDQRRLETIVLLVNADPGSPTKDDFSNCYFIELSAHNKSCTFSTSKVNGEICTFDAQFDMKNGKMVVQDDLGDSIMLDAKNTNIRMVNANGTFVELNKQDINMNSPRDINAVAAQNVNIQAAQNINIKAGVMAMIDGGGSVLTLQAGGTTLKTPTFNGGA